MFKLVSNKRSTALLIICTYKAFYAFNIYAPRVIVVFLKFRWLNNLYHVSSWVHDFSTIALRCDALRYEN